MNKMNNLTNDQKSLLMKFNLLKCLLSSQLILFFSNFVTIQTHLIALFLARVVTDTKHYIIARALLGMISRLLVGLHECV